MRTARSFRAWEGGGEYNVSRSLAKVFGQRTAVVTALVDNEVGHLVEDLIMAGGVSTEHIEWRPFDGLGFTRVGLNFTERGFGIRPPVGVSDRANSAASKLAPDEVDWNRLFTEQRARWFHTGGIFAGLSESCTDLAQQGMQAARANGTIVSYDVNLRQSLWESADRRPADVNRQMLEHADVVFGSIEDYRTGLGFDVPVCSVEQWIDEPERFRQLARDVVTAFPHIRVIGMTLRDARSAQRHRWGGLVAALGGVYSGRYHPDLEVFDRVGGGDGFVSGVVWSLLAGRDPGDAVEIGVALGALTMTTPGDTSMVDLSDVLRAVHATDARADR